MTSSAISCRDHDYFGSRLIMGEVDSGNYASNIEHKNNQKQLMKQQSDVTNADEIGLSIYSNTEDVPLLATSTSTSCQNNPVPAPLSWQCPILKWNSIGRTFTPKLEQDENVNSSIEGRGPEQRKISDIMSITTKIDTLKLKEAMSLNESSSSVVSFDGNNFLNDISNLEIPNASTIQSDLQRALILTSFRPMSPGVLPEKYKSPHQRLNLQDVKSEEACNGDEGRLSLITQRNKPNLDDAYFGVTNAANCASAEERIVSKEHDRGSVEANIKQRCCISSTTGCGDLVPDFDDKVHLANDTKSESYSNANNNNNNNNNNGDGIQTGSCIMTEKTKKDKRKPRTPKAKTYSKPVELQMQEKITIQTEDKACSPMAPGLDKNKSLSIVDAVKYCSEEDIVNGVLLKENGCDCSLDITCICNISQDEMRLRLTLEKTEMLEDHWGDLLKLSQSEIIRKARRHTEEFVYTEDAEKLMSETDLSVWHLINQL